MGGREMFIVPSHIIRQLVGIPDHKVIISECELVGSIIAILLLRLLPGLQRIAIFRTDNLNGPQWAEADKSESGLPRKLLRLLIRRCVNSGVWIIPRYFGSAHYIAADGLTRRSDYEHRQRILGNDMAHVDLPLILIQWGRDWDRQMRRRHRSRLLNCRDPC